MEIYATRIDEFITDYWKRAWEDGFEGDSNINKEINKTILEDIEG